MVKYLNVTNKIKEAFITKRDKKKLVIVLIHMLLIVEYLII